MENAYLDKYREERIAKQKRDLDRWRTAICNVSLHTKKQITDLQGKEGKLYQKMKVKDLFDTKKKMENRMMLDVMQIDSQKWPTLADLNTKINENVVLP